MVAGNTVATTRMSSWGSSVEGASCTQLTQNRKLFPAKAKPGLVLKLLGSSASRQFLPQLVKQTSEGPKH